MFDPEVGFTSSEIRDPNRFVGRIETLRNCIHALNSSVGLIAVYGKRGVGKSSLIRQIQQMALGDYSLARKAGLHQEIPEKPRKYLTVYYACDSLIQSGHDLLSRLCNHQDEEDGLLRLVPDDGKNLVEFSRSREANVGADLKLVSWGAKGVETSRYAKVVPGDTVQTFRNFVSSIVSSQVKGRMKRDALLILLDEFDVIGGKENIGSIIKSLSTSDVKFGISGIATDLMDLVHDHGSVSRLVEQGLVEVKPMEPHETIEIINRAEELYDYQLTFSEEVKNKIVEYSQGYPYFAQLLGKTCVQEANKLSSTHIDNHVFGFVMERIRSGAAFPTFEAEYNRAVGEAEERKTLLHLLAEQSNDTSSDGMNRVYLKDIRADAVDLDVNYLDQLLPRLVDRKFGPVLTKVPEKQGVYEFVNPVFKIYVRLRNF